MPTSPMLEASGAAPIACCCASANPPHSSKQKAKPNQSLSQAIMPSTLDRSNQSALTRADDITLERACENTPLTRNHLVAYYLSAMDEVFRALADASRRLLLDRLHAK